MLLLPFFKFLKSKQKYLCRNITCEKSMTVFIQKNSMDGVISFTLDQKIQS